MKPGEDGLCPGCRHVKVVRNDRGSIFFLCRLSQFRPGYRKYPPQPVVRCDGFDLRPKQ